LARNVDSFPGFPFRLLQEEILQKGT
jgi:hypothetical protein